MGHRNRNRNQLDYEPLNRRAEDAAANEQELEAQYDDAGLNEAPTSPEALPGPWSGLASPPPAEPTAAPDRNVMDYVPLNRRNESEENASPAAPPPMPPATRVAPARESAEGLAAPSPRADESGSIVAKYAGDDGGMKDEVAPDELVAAQNADRERQRRAQIIGGFAKILSGGRAETPDANAHEAADVLARRQSLLQARGAERSDQYLDQERLMFDARQRREGEDRQAAMLQALDEARRRDPSSPESQRHQALVASLRPNVSPEARSQLSADDVDARALINQQPPTPARPGRDYASEEAQRHQDAMELERLRQQGRPRHGGGAGGGGGASGADVEHIREVYLEQQMQRLPAEQRTPEERQRRHDQIWSIPIGGVGGVRRGIATGLSGNSPTPAERADTLDTRVGAQNARTDAAGQQHVTDTLEREGIPETRVRIGQAEQALAGASPNDVSAALMAMNHPNAASVAQAVGALSPEARHIAQDLSGLQNIMLRVRSGTAVTDPETRRLQMELGTRTFGSAADVQRGLQNLRRVMDAQEATIRGGAPHLSTPTGGGSEMLWTLDHSRRVPVPADRVDEALRHGYSR